jgi:molybdenum cofactor guanylyltransferase
MTGIILSGGKNKRMGTNKAFLCLGGERLIDRTIRIYKEIFDEIILVTNSPLDYIDLSCCTIVTDIVKGKGSLGGIYTGLFHASYDHAFVTACDMPFLNGGAIKYMIERSADFDIVVPECREGLQPLHAVYSRQCIPAIKRCLEKDMIKIISFYKGLKALALPEGLFRQFDPEGNIFTNVNTQQDLELITSHQP